MQACAFIHQLPNRHDISRLIIERFTAVNGDYGWDKDHPPNMFLFPNLKEVTFVKRVRPIADIRDPTDPWEENFYWFRHKCNSSATARGFTHFVDTDELESSTRISQAGRYCHLDSFKQEMQRTREDLDRSIKSISRKFREYSITSWNTPVFHFKGIRYDRIEPNRFFCGRHGKKDHT